MSEEQSVEILCANVQRLPIFPLKGIVLLPHAVLPLHIFEPRYVQLLEDVLDSHKLMCMTNTRPHELSTSESSLSDIHTIAGVGQIVQHMHLPDNRHFILLKGIASVQIEAELSSTRMYREVRASVLQPLDETLPPQAQSEIRVLLQSIILHSPSNSESIQELLSLSELKVAQLNALASICVQPSNARQEYLEQRSIESRIEAVTDGLAQALAYMSQDDH